MSNLRRFGLALSAAVGLGMVAEFGSARATTFVEDVTLPLTVSLNNAFGEASFAPVTFGASDDVILNVTYAPPLDEGAGHAGYASFLIHVQGDDGYPGEIVPGTDGYGKISYDNTASEISGFSVDVHFNPGPFVPDARATIDRISLGFYVPEPSTWALMIGGFGLAGAQLRRRRLVA